MDYSKYSTNHIYNKLECGLKSALQNRHKLRQSRVEKAGSRSNSSPVFLAEPVPDGRANDVFQNQMNVFLLLDMGAGNPDTEIDVLGLEQPRSLDGQYVPLHLIRCDARETAATEVGVVGTEGLQHEGCLVVLFIRLRLRGRRAANAGA